MFPSRDWETSRTGLSQKGIRSVMRHLGVIEGSVHCKDKGPAECGLDLLEFLEGCGGCGVARARAVLSAIDVMRMYAFRMCLWDCK